MNRLFPQFAKMTCFGQTPAFEAFDALLQRRDVKKRRACSIAEKIAKNLPLTKRFLMDKSASGAFLPQRQPTPALS
jgi:hypothetical protein